MPVRGRGPLLDLRALGLAPLMPLQGAHWVRAMGQASQGGVGTEACSMPRLELESRASRDPGHQQTGTPRPEPQKKPPRREGEGEHLAGRTEAHVTPNSAGPGPREGAK